MRQLDIQNITEGSWLKYSLDDLYQLISHYYAVDEHQYISELYPIAYKESEQRSIEKKAAFIIENVRNNNESFFFDIEALLQEYSLSNEDGITLMCLAEALLRVPDNKTRDALITDKLSHQHWQQHFSKDNTVFVNAATWSLTIAGKLVNTDKDSITGLFKNFSKPVIRVAIDKAMRIMGQHFVLGRTIQEAIENGQSYIEKGYSYSYDMLGESAITENEASRYYESYQSAIPEIARYSKAHNKDSDDRPSLSIKLSALYPRFEETHRELALNKLSSLIEKLAAIGIEHNVGITFDAEEADRLELTLAIFEKVYSLPMMRGWGKFGLVIQAYSKRALPTLCWVTQLAKTFGDEIPVRLVKGAYWDTEIKHSQELGLENYPVYTRKEYTDIAYLACARYLLSDVTKGAIYPQFASHNAQTVASIQVIAPENRSFEFQRLHGMGDKLYDSILASGKQTVRIYAPVGSNEDLLPYLVRRLLENGANSSFVHQLSDNNTAIENLTQWPLKEEDIGESHSTNIIPLPSKLFKNRKNSSGVNLASTNTRESFMQSINDFENTIWNGFPIINGEKITSSSQKDVINPFNSNEMVGSYYEADASMAQDALAVAEKGKFIWRNMSIEKRCQIIEKLADKLEEHRDELTAICQREAGKTVQDSIDEIREAIDFCRYYSQQARKNFLAPTSLSGPTGESNHLLFEPKGIFVCISPWNFPLAIFIGQITAALLAGNTVIAKPAEATSLMACRAIELFLECGLPPTALQLLPGPGSELGPALNTNPQVNGVAFTGSNLTAHKINQALNSRGQEVPLATLIAETGGLNAMIVDSTALPEQAVKDVIASAFKSAGQRCSALRVLYVQEDIAERVITLIKGAMEELIIGNPQLLTTDVGPVIDQQAQNKLLAYIEDMKNQYKSWFQIPLPKDCSEGTFVAPTLFEIDSILSLKEEQFGPILHIVRYPSDQLEQVVQDINRTQYGLTLGIHSRNKATYDKICQLAQVGNIYINRNQVGAVVGVNPFGGQGLSGTGPKAGGPNYLLRFVTEKTITNNIAAIGGNVELLGANGS